MCLIARVFNQIIHVSARHLEQSSKAHLRYPQYLHLLVCVTPTVRQTMAP